MSGAGNANNQAILRLCSFQYTTFPMDENLFKKNVLFTVFGWFAENICSKIFSVISFVCKIKYNKFLFLH